MIKAYPLADYHQIFNPMVVGVRPTMCRQMINTCLTYVRWDGKDPANFVAAAQHRLGVDTQALTQQRNPNNGLANNRDAQVALTTAADALAAELHQRCERFGARPVPLTINGAYRVINFLKKTQPRQKIEKMKKIAKQIPWDALQGCKMKCVPHSGTTLFIKAESYPGKDKPPRLICFPQEGEKLLMSMGFYHLMNPMFSSRYCTKEIPEHHRPNAIEQRLSMLPKRFVADYTSFECVPNRLMMRLGEHRVYRKLIPTEYHFLLDYIESGGVLKARNGVTIHTPAVQFSGRYTTSLSNTIRNKLLMDSAAILTGVGLNNYRGVFEGDDSLTSWPEYVTQDDIENALGKLGVAVDMAEYPDLGRAGYCSMYWNDKKELVCDPIKVIATFPFTNSMLGADLRNYSALTSAKAMSLAYRSPGCPIVSAIVRRYLQPMGLMETRNSYEARWFRAFTKQIRGSQHHKSMRVEFSRWDLVREPTIQQRQLFYDIFGIDPVDQKLAEQHILQDDGFTIHLLNCLVGAEQKCGVNLKQLQDVYTAMRERARPWISARRF